jgi:K+-transporting ATPase KdpC subunit
LILWGPGSDIDVDEVISRLVGAPRELPACFLGWCTHENQRGNNMIWRQVRTAAASLFLLTLLTGLLYPLLVTGVAQLAFPNEANGSLLKKDGRVLGSGLIGQPFSHPRYFWSRLSATPSVQYNASSSSGSNYGPLNPALLEAVQRRIKALKQADPQNTSPIPVDLVTASGSGLDPHISVLAALYQVSRVARVRNIREDRIRQLVDQFTEGRQLGFLGEPRVNVLKLNLALDGIQRSEGH